MILLGILIKRFNNIEVQVGCKPNSTTSKCWANEAINREF